MNTRRREERVAVSLAVRVWGMDASHKPFTQTATALDLTRAGVRIGGLSCQLQAGEVVGIQHGNEKARFRVVWAGKKGGAQTGQAGLVCVETGKYIWGLPLQRLAAAAKPPSQSSGQVSVAAPEPVSTAPVETAKQITSERRSDTRYPVTGGVEIANAQDGSKIWGVITDVGPSGCYVEMTVPPKPGTRLPMVVSVMGADIHCTGEVRNSHQGVGMGVGFVEMSPEDTYRLEEIVRRLAAGIDIPVAPEPRKIADTTPKRPPDPKALTLAGHLRSVTSALRSIEDLIASFDLGLDDRVMREFRRTLDHSRENARSLQQWLEEGADHKSLYNLLDQMEVKRIGAAVALIRELSMDVDANALHLGTEGMADLATAVDQLSRRLTAMARGNQTVREDDQDSGPR